MKNRLMIWFTVAMGLTTFSGSLFAHHGAASFDTTKQYTLKGTVVEWFCQSPLLPEVRCKR